MVTRLAFISLILLGLSSAAVTTARSQHRQPTRDRWHYYNRAPLTKSRWRSVWFLEMRPMRIMAENYNLQVAAKPASRNRTRLRFSFFHLHQDPMASKTILDCCRSQVVSGKVFACRLLTDDGFANVEVKTREKGRTRVRNFFIDAHQNDVWEHDRPR